MASNIIEARELTFSYSQAENDPNPALKNIFLTIRSGQFVAILGHNGSGKSTFAKHANAILLPSSGHIYVRGIDTLDESKIFDVRQTVGMGFQNPDNSIVASVVEEDVAFGLENLGIPTAEIRQRVDAALRTVGMYDHRMHSPHMLSGGQKQRVAIAGIIAMRPDCIVMDEPTAMLDPVGRREVMDTIRILCDKFGITIILITHHMYEAAEADRVIVMNDGEILADGTPKNVFTHVKEMSEVGLSVPQSVQLLYLLRENGCDLPLEALSEEECAGVIYSYFK